MHKSDIRTIIDRLIQAIEGGSLSDLARFLGVVPSAINGAIRKRQIPDVWLYKVAEHSGRRIEWLRTGEGQEMKNATVRDLIEQVKALERYRHDMQRWGSERGEIAKLLSDLDLIVRLAERASIAADGQAVYDTKGQASAPRELQSLDEEERATVDRLIAAFRSGNQKVRAHLIGQLQLIDEYVEAKRAKPTAAKKTKNRS